MADISGCEVSSDCTSNVTGVVKVCYENPRFSKETFICECSAWYGWTGERCDEFSAQNAFMLIFLLIFSIWSIFNLYAMTRTFYLHWRFGHKKKKGNIALGTLFLLLLSNFLVLVNSLGNFLAIVDSTRYEIVSYDVLSGDVVEDVSITHGKPLAYVLLFAASLFSLASLEIFSSWQRVILLALRFGTARSKFVASRVLLGIRVFIFLFIVLFFLVLVFDQLAMGILLVGLVVLCLSVGYPVSYILLKETFSKLEVDENQFVQDVALLIRFCCRVNAIASMLNGVLLIVFYPLLVFERRLLSPGSLNFVVLFRDLALLCGLSQATVMAWYINSITSRENYMGGNSCFVWRKWDAQFEKLRFLAFSSTGYIHTATYPPEKSSVIF